MSKTETDALLEFLVEIKSLRNEILLGTASLSHYNKLESNLIMVGLERAFVQELYADAGFSGWPEFLAERSKGHGARNEHRIEIVLHNIRGSVDAILETGKKQLRQND